MALVTRKNAKKKVGRPVGTTGIPQGLNRYIPPRCTWTDYQGLKLNMGDIVRHMLDEPGNIYRIKRMLRKPSDSVELEFLNGPSRRGYKIVPSEVLMKDAGLNSRAQRGESVV